VDTPTRGQPLSSPTPTPAPLPWATLVYMDLKHACAMGITARGGQGRVPEWGSEGWWLWLQTTPTPSPHVEPRAVPAPPPPPATPAPASSWMPSSIGPLEGEEARRRLRGPRGAGAAAAETLSQPPSAAAAIFAPSPVSRGVTNVGVANRGDAGSGSPPEASRPLLPRSTAGRGEENGLRGAVVVTSWAASVMAHGPGGGAVEGEAQNAVLGADGDLPLKSLGCSKAVRTQ
jgi:hypothetical protein